MSKCSSYFNRFRFLEIYIFLFAIACNWKQNEDTTKKYNMYDDTMWIRLRICCNIQVMQQIRATMFWTYINDTESTCDDAKHIKCRSWGVDNVARNMHHFVGYWTEQSRNNNRSNKEKSALDLNGTNHHSENILIYLHKASLRDASRERQIRYNFLVNKKFDII